MRIIYKNLKKIRLNKLIMHQEEIDKKDRGVSKNRNIKKDKDIRIQIKRANQSRNHPKIFIIKKKEIYLLEGK